MKPALLLALLLVGCVEENTRAPVAAPAPACYLACTPSLTDTGERLTCDAADPACWDVLGEELVPAMSRKLLACEARRQECAGFIRDLTERGIIRAKE